MKEKREAWEKGRAGEGRRDWDKVTWKTGRRMRVGRNMEGNKLRRQGEERGSETGRKEKG